MLFEFSINLESELQRLLGTYEIVIPEIVRKELTNLASQGHGKKQQQATAATKLIARYPIIPSIDGVVDDVLLTLSEQINAYVLTNDKTLRKRLQQQGIKTIYLRGKQKLEMDQ